MPRLLVSTTKGAFPLKSDPARRTWTIQRPWFFGHIVNHVVTDPRDPKMMLAAVRAGHLGPTMMRSTDAGKSWKEVAHPPRFEKTDDPRKPQRVEFVFHIVPGHPTEGGVWYCGTSPQALFRSDDHGETWKSVSGFNENPNYRNWAGGEQDGTPGGPTMHSVCIDPRDPRHMYIAMSSGGVFESHDRGASWKPMNTGCAIDFSPDPNVPYGHDPHHLEIHPLMPDRLYQQNHCGIYRIDRPSDKWTRIGNNMPKTIGDIGFPITLHPRDPDTAWVFPMDGTQVWPRTSPGGKPAVFVTHNAGRTWKKQSKGLPLNNGWFTVYRQAMTHDGASPLGLYFGTTSGEVWASRNEGDSWACIARHLPKIQAVEIG